MLVGRAGRRGRHRQEAEGAPRHGDNNVPRDGHDTLTGEGGGGDASGADTIAVTGRAFRLHPGITQEVAPNESQRGPKATTTEALIQEALFVALWLQSRFEKGS
jgi:hypothetical protein